ncbi:hypothetical protein KIN20_014878 [Parelaphostrongylus tenuis]|uniref:Uncharacterized protein n=1 Tax=Parelaphostrongylus tenuis TaxID=148309 RepID=A0AAD5N3L5_PARTN|nr:hypothetical protein KIN20_014878 [Parelaphostrongylus tenuis]
MVRTDLTDVIILAEDALIGINSDSVTKPVFSKMRSIFATLITLLLVQQREAQVSDDEGAVTTSPQLSDNHSNVPYAALFDRLFATPKVTVVDSSAEDVSTSTHPSTDSALT